MTKGGPIDKAIDAVEAATPDPAVVARTLTEVPVLIGSTGRPAIILAPINLTMQESIELASFVLLQLRGELAIRGHHGLIVPSAVLDG
jgi:hypothetical protein